MERFPELEGEESLAIRVFVAVAHWNWKGVAPMEQHPNSTSTPASDLVIAVFLHHKGFRDSLVDLSHAGFTREQVRVVFPVKSMPIYTRREDWSRSDLSEAHKEEHTLHWKLRQSFLHDLHRRGRNQMAGRQGNESSGDWEHMYTEKEIHEIFLPLGVSEARIRLLNNEMGPDGAMIVVQSGWRSKEAQSILEKNFGFIRTDSATENSPLLSA